MTKEVRPTILNYASPRRHDSSFWLRAVRGFYRVWQRISLPVAAAILLIPYYVAHYQDRFSLPDIVTTAIGFLPFFAIFLPGALRRGNVRSIIICSGGALVAYGVDKLQVRIQGGRYYFEAQLAIMALLVMLVAICEQWSTRNAKLSRLAWSAIGAVAVASLVTAITYSLVLCGAETAISRWSRLQIGWLIWPLEMGVFAWIAIGWAARAASTRDWRRITFLLTSGLAVAIWIGIFVFALMPLARRSLFGGGPITRANAVWVLDQSGSSADLETVYRALDQSNWNELEDPYEPAVPGWKKYAITVLTDRQPRAAAERFSKTLLAHPNLHMANACAPLFAREKRFETAPLLLRYALADMPGTNVQAEACSDALEEMRVAGIAERIIIKEWAWQMATSNSKPVFDSRMRQRLQRLIGTDAGDDPSDWYKLFVASGGLLPTPMSEQQKLEIQKLLLSSRKYRTTWYNLRKAGLGVALLASEPNLDAATTDEYCRQIYVYIEQANRAMAKNGGEP